MGEQIRIELPEPHYTLFDAVRSGKPEIIVVNDALLAFRHRYFPVAPRYNDRRQEFGRERDADVGGEQSLVRDG